MSALVVVVLCAAVTFALRASVVVALGERPVPAPLRRASGYILPATMSALAAGALVPAGGGAPDLRLVIVALAGTIAAVRSRSVAWTFLAGLAAYGMLVVTRV